MHDRRCEMIGDAFAQGDEAAVVVTESARAREKRYVAVAGQIADGLVDPRRRRLAVDVRAGVIR